MEIARIRQSFKIVAALLVLFVVVGCESTGRLEITKHKVSTIPPGKTVALAVDPSVKNPDEDTMEVMQRVRTELFGRLVSDRIFSRVVHGEKPADYRMQVTVQAAHEVSTAARIFLGVFAGANSLSLSVLLEDEHTGQSVTAFDVTGESASHPFSTEAGLDDAVREAVTKISSALR